LIDLNLVALAPKNAARRRSEGEATAMCISGLRGLRERSRASPVVFEPGLCVGRASPAGVAGGRCWRASLAGVAGGRRRRASLAESQAKPQQPPRRFQLRQQKHPALPSAENSAKPSNGGGTRETPQRSAEKTPPRSANDETTNTTRHRELRDPRPTHPTVRFGEWGLR
jgi:hypothetical protein